MRRRFTRESSESFASESVGSSRTASVHSKRSIKTDTGTIPTIKTALSDAFTLFSDSTPYERRFSVNVLQSAALICVFDELCNTLDILGNVDKYFNDIDLPLRYVTMDERFKRNFESQNIPKDNMDLEAFKRHRLRKSLQQVLTIVRQEILSTRTFKYFMDFLSDVKMKYVEEYQLEKHYTQNQNVLNELYMLRGNLLSKREQDIADKNDEIAKLKDTYQDSFFEMKIKERYVRNWENSRSEQGNQIIEATEKNLTESLKHLQIVMDRENKIHDEIVHYLEESQKDYEENTEKWMERYDADIELKDAELQVMKEKREEQFDRIEKLAKLYEEHKDQMTRYLDLHNKRSEVTTMQTVIDKAASFIQAWWKGIMVRQRLGPYKKLFKKLQKERKAKFLLMQSGKKPPTKQTKPVVKKTPPLKKKKK